MNSSIPINLLMIVDDVEKEVGTIGLPVVPALDSTIVLQNGQIDEIKAFQVVGVRYDAWLGSEHARVCVFIDPIMSGLLRSEAREELDHIVAQDGGDRQEMVATLTLNKVITGPITFQDLMTYKPIEVEGAHLAHYLVDSKLLVSFGYSFDTHDFEAQFKNGAVWSYAEVAEALFYEFLASESHGSFFIDKIRGIEWVKNPLHRATKLKEGLKKSK
jgi:hypothetical protein